MLDVDFWFWYLDQFFNIVSVVLFLAQIFQKLKTWLLGLSLHRSRSYIDYCVCQDDLLMPHLFVERTLMDSRLKFCFYFLHWTNNFSQISQAIRSSNLLSIWSLHANMSCLCFSTKGLSSALVATWFCQ